MKRASQTDKIRQMFIERAGQQIPAFELAAISLQYNARIWELRREGFEIINSTQKRTDGTIYSWYRHPAPKGQLSLLDVQSYREANA